MDDIERMVRTIFHQHGRTLKIPLEAEEKMCYDYEEDYIIQKLLYRYEIREQIMKKGYTHEQAENMISESVLRGIIDLKSIDPDGLSNRDKNKYVMANEEYWVKEEFYRLRDRVIEGFMESEVKDYVLEFQFGWEDEDEEKLREVYAEHNKKELSKNQLIKGLVEKGYTEKQAEKLLERYTTIEIGEEEKKDWDEAEKLFKRPEYKPLKHYENKRIVKLKNKDKSIFEIKNEDFIIIDISVC